MFVKKLGALLLCISFLSAGCASYKPNIASDARMEQCNNCKQTQGGVTVGLVPYFNPARTMGVFDNDFKDHELLALDLMMDCPDGKDYTCKKADITVSDSNGKTLKRVDGKEAGNMVGRGYGTSVVWFFVGGVVGLTISAVHTSSINTKIENDLMRVELPENVKVKGLSHGFVYFDMAPYKKTGPPKEMSANVKLLDDATNQELAYSVKFDPNAGL